ncbi:MAG: dihydroneopterin aldolase [Verrucomicrobia bacterium]|nr:MAG: dihydroneopterin aldolase [Verrucomicrobiota bacterium]
MPNEPNLLSDQIHIEQLEISTHIGVPEEERATPQRLTVSITLWPRHNERDLGDNIDKTVNYSAVAEAAKSFARDQSVNLIETLADRLATHLLGTFAIQKITIELRKFVLEDAKYASVTVTRTAVVN